MTEQEEFEFRARMESESAAQAVGYDPTEGMSTTDRALAGAGKAFADAGRGVGQMLGLVSQADIDEAKRLDAPLMKTTAGSLGNIGGSMAMLAPTAMIPGANTMAGAATIGALQGALLTPGDLSERGKAAGFGAAGGAAGAGLSRLMAGAAPAGVSPNVRTLADEGISLTPGQNAGGWLKGFEDKATSMPIVGNIINNARMRGIEDFNQAAIRRATLPGMNVQGVGNAAVQDVRQGLGQAYDELLPNLGFRSDAKFIDDLANIRDMAELLPKKSGMHGKEINQFEEILNKQLTKRMTPQGNMSGETLKVAESEIGRLAKGYRSDPSFDNRQLGDALSELQNIIRQNLTRNNPDQADALKNINSAYANFKRIQRAASGVGAEDGVFTPAQLHNAARAMDRTKDKRAFSEGDALMQDLTAAGKAVMPSKVPDSGTAGRLMNNMFSLGGLASTAGGLAASIPAYVAYSRPGSAAINAVVNNGVKPATNALQRLLADNPNMARIIGMVGAGYAQQ
jgi:hypothetical protein